VLGVPLTVHEAAPQHTPLEQAERPLHMMAQLRPVHDAPEGHAASPVQAICPASALTVTPPTHDDSPEQAMSQVPALQVTAPVHEDEPQVTEHVAPPQLTE
jgi:hypothetical protein